MLVDGHAGVPFNAGTGYLGAAGGLALIPPTVDDCVLEPVSFILSTRPEHSCKQLKY